MGQVGPRPLTIYTLLLHCSDGLRPSRNRGSAVGAHKLPLPLVPRPGQPHVSRRVGQKTSATAYKSERWWTIFCTAKPYLAFLQENHEARRELAEPRRRRLHRAGLKGSRQDSAPKGIRGKFSVVSFRSRVTTGADSCDLCDVTPGILQCEWV